MKKTILFFLSLTFLCSCGPTQEEYDQVMQSNDELKKQIQTLQQELDGFRYAPEKLLAQGNESYKKKDLDELKIIGEKLKLYHPESDEAIKIQNMINSIEKELKEKEEKEKAQRLAAVNKLKKSFDDVSGITWYRNPYFTHYANSNMTSLCIGEKEDDLWLRLTMSYYGSDWIFFEQAYLSYDGKTHSIDFNRYQNKETENSGGSVWEWIDVPVDQALLSFLNELKDGKTPKMRLSGKYTKTRNLSPNEIKGIRDVLLAYDVLSEEKKNTE